jgi:hypothetical protein
MKTFLVLWTAVLSILSAGLGAVVGLVWLFDHGYHWLAAGICCVIVSGIFAVSIWWETNS